VGEHGEPTRPQATWRCACGFAADSVALLEDHLFAFPEDEHYELAPPPPRTQPRPRPVTAAPPGR
jgi:hypothetical protein